MTVSKINKAIHVLKVTKMKNPEYKPPEYKPFSNMSPLLTNTKYLPNIIPHDYKPP